MAAGRANSDAAGEGGAQATSGAVSDDGVVSDDGGLRGRRRSTSTKVDRNIPRLDATETIATPCT
jgi:hypothetical protein